ncbi:MAG: plasmid pRiA4b ORF-3 family protein [Bacteroidota bacterium]
MSNILQFKVQLLDISKPPIWRKIEVSEEETFYDLHNIIQRAMGWYNAHLHQFILEHTYIGIPHDDDFMDMEDGRKIKLQQVFRKPKDKLIYEYDFGDGWRHQVTLEAIVAPEKGFNYPRLTKGKSACPPEDCGGPWGYTELREKLNNPKHPEYEDFREWMMMEEEEVFDPKQFDLEEHQESMLELYEMGKKSKGKEFRF